MGSAWKIAAFLILLTSFYIGFGIIMNGQLSHIAGLAEQLQEHSLVVTRSALTASRDTIAISRNAKDMVLVPEEEHRRSRLTEIDLYEKSIEQNMNLVLERIEGEQGKDLAMKAMMLLKEQKDLRKRLVHAIFAGNDKLAARLARDEGIILMRKIEAAMTKIANYAEAKSMQYRVQSINDLRQSKVIFFSGGLMIIILTASFAIFLVITLFRSLRHSKIAIVEASQVPIDLRRVLETPSVGNINASVNLLLGNLYNELRVLATLASELESEFEKSHALEGQLPETVEKIASKLKAITKTIRSLPDTHRQGERSLKILEEMFNQIKGDLLLIGQCARSQDLRINELEIIVGHSSKEANDLLQSIKNQEHIFRDSVDRGGRSVDHATELLTSLKSQIGEILNLTNQQMEIVSSIYQLEAPMKIYENHIARLKEIQEQLSQTLKSLKLS